MPGVLPKYLPLEKELMAEYDKERKARNTAIDKLWRWREGHHPPTLKVDPESPDDNIYFNLAGQVVDDIGGGYHRSGECSWT
jgi:hypothetical protein